MRTYILNTEELLDIDFTSKEAFLRRWIRLYRFSKLFKKAFLDLLGSPSGQKETPLDFFHEHFAAASAEISLAQLSLHGIPENGYLSYFHFRE